MKHGEDKPSSAPLSILVLGMGAYAYGREHRTVRMFGAMSDIEPQFLISKWEDGSVSSLLGRYGFPYQHAGLGYLGFAKPWWSLVTLAHLPSVFYKGFAAFVRGRCRCLVVLELSSCFNFLIPLLFLRYLFKKPIVFYLGDIPHDSTLSRFLGTVIRVTKSKLIANSAAVRNGLMDIGIPGEQCSVIFNGIDLADFSTPPSPVLPNPEESEGRVTLGYMGQIAAHKGIWDFLDMLAIVKKTFPGVRAVVFGAEHEEGKIMTRLREHVVGSALGGVVELQGRTPQPARAYANMDIVVVPSRFADPAPNVVIEAMACGLPVVATAVGGIPELVTHGKSGYLVRVGDVNEMAARVIGLCKNPESRIRMGIAARERAQRLFDIRRNSSALRTALFQAVQ